MYCPKCSQQQLSDEIRYCSRCGFSLSVVSEILRDEGGTANNVSVKEIKRSALLGFGLVTLSAVFLLATLIIGTPEPSFVVQLNLLVAILVYLCALGYVFFKLWPLGRSNRIARAEPPTFERAPTTRNLLNEPDLSDYVAANSRVHDASPIEPVGTSVTEDTTSLLKDD
jgi:hypothetical protein